MLGLLRSNVFDDVEWATGRASSL